MYHNKSEGYNNSLLSWSEQDQIKFEACKIGWAYLVDSFVDEIARLIQDNPTLLQNLGGTQRQEKYLKLLKSHFQRFIQDPRSPASQKRSHSFGHALIYYKVSPSWYISVYNRLFPIAHTILHDYPDVAPPIEIIRKRWLWDIGLTLDVYHEEIAKAWSRERGQLQRTVSNLQTEAQTDFLTSLLNRRGIQEVIASFVGKDNTNSMFVLLDLDGFKAINDQKGHMVGDYVLKVIGETLSSSIRRSDYAGRIGGDEFCLWLPQLQRLEEASDRLRSIIRQLPLKEWDLSISAGIAFYPIHGKNFSDIYKRADEVLYVAKRNGKNCFVFAGDDQIRCHSYE